MEDQNPLQTTPSIPVQTQPIVPPTPQPAAEPQPIVPTTSPILEQKSKFPKWMIVAIVAIVLIVILTGGYFLLQNSTSKTQLTTQTVGNQNSAGNLKTHDRVGDAGKR